MEQKKTLWIIAATGVFLLVVLLGPLISFNQSSDRNFSAKNSISPVEKPVAKSGWISDPAAQPDTNIAMADQAPLPLPPGNELKIFTDNATIYSDNTYASASNNGTTIDLNSLKNPSVSEPAQNQNINITVNVSDDKKADAFVAAPAEFNVTEPKITKTEAPKANAVETVKPVKQSVSVKPAKTESKPAAVKTASEPKKITQYWVQVAAYSNKKMAETARTALDSNKITSDIFTYKDNKDKLFYRVRVGPYTTKSEAEYWKSRILKISDFAKAESYVTSTTN